jgi:hypothetical protein
MEMMGEKHFIEDLDEGYRSLGKMLQGPVRDNVRSPRLVDLETPGGFLDLVSVG